MTNPPKKRNHLFLIWIASFLPVAPILASTVGADRKSADPNDNGRWRVYAGSTAPDADWSKVDFDDSRWPLGRVGFNDGVYWVLQDLPEVRSLGSKRFVRGHFVVANPEKINRLTIEIASNGPVVVYLNGIEAMRSRIPLPFSVELGSGIISGYSLDLSHFAEELLPGENVIAIEVIGEDSAGGTLVFVPKLRITTTSVEPEERFIETLVSTSPVSEPNIEPSKASQQVAGCCAKYAIVMIADGRGAKQIEATNQFTGSTPSYQSDPSWTLSWMSTFPAGGGYDSDRAWSEFDYVLQGPTDSAAAATAMYTGEKTQNGRITVQADGGERLFAIGELARSTRKSVGAVTTVPVSHATPGAWTSHNESRANTYAIADEAFFENPNTTGTPSTDPKYDGGYGQTVPAIDVLIGDRSPSYVHASIQAKLFGESGLPGKPILVEGASGSDGGIAILSAANNPTTLKLAGLFDRVNLRATTIDNGYVLETPTLSEASQAALSVLERDPDGFVLLIEGGAVDWAGHANDLDRSIGESRDFDSAVAQVVDWVENPSNGSSWTNTLVVVTSDHETGYLTKAPGVFADQPLEPGAVSGSSLVLEKIDLGTGRRASWEDDSPANGIIDPGETVYWAWNSGGHSNSLVPFFAHGVGSSFFPELQESVDQVRGAYIDNTSVWTVLQAVIHGTIFCDGFESGDVSTWSSEP